MRISMKGPRNHFLRGGNTNRNNAKVDQFRDSLHYKNESPISFEIFFTKCHNIYNIFEEEGAQTEEDAKTCSLLKQPHQ